MFLPAPIACLDAARQLVVVDTTGRAVPLAADVKWASWSQREHEDIHSWPTWSPDGRTIAAFRIARDGSGSRVVLCAPGSVSEVEGATIGDRMPIHLAWSPDGRQVAVLSHADDALRLDAMDASRPGALRTLLTGSPLFFAWVDPERIAAFVGEQDASALVVLGPQGRTTLPGTPGHFCAPVPISALPGPPEIAWVTEDGPRVALRVCRADGTGSRALEIVDGLVALLPSGDGGLLRAVAPDRTGAAYRDLRHLDPVTGRARRISDTDCVAFFPAGGVLVVARRTSRGTVAFSRLTTDGAREDVLAEVFPSRDLRFWLRFFEQYHPSHPLVDRAGRVLLLAGGLVGGPDPEGAPRLWAVPLSGGRPEELGAGLFATFAPIGEEA